MIARDEAVCDRAVDSMTISGRENCYEINKIMILAGIGLACVAVAKIIEARTIGAIAVSCDPWSLAAFTAAQVILGWNRRWTPACLVIGGGLGLAIAYTSPAMRPYAEPIGIGVVSAASLVVAALTSRGHRWQSAYVFSAGVLVLIGHQLAQSGQYLSTTASLSFDSRAYLVDRSFGFDAIAIVLATLHWLPPALAVAVGAVVAFVYMNLLLAMACTVLFRLRNRSPEWAVTLAAFLLAGAAGAALYHLFPAAGPRFAFASYPVLPDVSKLSTDASLLPPAFVRNCMPSLHTAWALLIVMNTRSASVWIRRLAVGFAGLTLIATLALGEHYLIDLVVAVPFAVAVQAMAKAVVTRTWPGLAAWGGSVCVAIWFFVLIRRVSWLLTIPGLTLAASILTVAICLFLALRELAPHRNQPREKAQARPSPPAPREAWAGS